MEEIIKNLNEFLCDLEVMNVKLQNYHWNVQGKGFFITHEKLEEYYDEIRVQIDEIAEHILALGYEPLGTMQDFMKNSEIQEAKRQAITSIDVMRYKLEQKYNKINESIKAKQIAKAKEKEYSDYEVN